VPPSKTKPDYGVPLPDTSKADARAAIRANYKEPVEWIKLDSAKAEFTRVTYMPDGKDGLLIETGTYKTFDNSSHIVFDNIKGTYYDREDTELWKNVPREDESETLVYYAQSADIMFVCGTKMYKAK
jgi:hypothetical protein